ncbi:MAG: hypothetical protein JO002_13755 [Burkholderiaceae bacterium]|nr:hypothetical protein [Burkholderiaceae bacterium]
MVAASAAEQSAVSHAAGNAAIEQSLFLLKTDREAVRAAHWNSLPEQTRKYICHMAEIGADKGALPLRDLNAFDRGRVNRTAQRLMRELETLIRCAQGGDIPVAVGGA